MIGETKSALATYGQLKEGDKLPYKIPFPLGMDNLARTSEEISMQKIIQCIYPQIPEFDLQPEDYLNQVIQKVRDYMKLREYSAETFEKFSLRLHAFDDFS